METPPALVAERVDREAAAAVIAGALGAGRPVLSAPEAFAFLSAYGIPTAATGTAPDPEMAAAIAARIGFPVVLKILSDDIVHKSDVGGVRLELDSAEAVRDAALHMLKRVAEFRPDARIDGFSVQKMIRRHGAHEVIVGFGLDAVFGPVLVIGQGGTAAEVIRDRAIGLPPLNMLLAREMIGRTRIARLMGGEVAQLAATLVKLSQMLVDHPELVELDINPLLADGNGIVALDARVAVRAASGAGSARFAIQPYPQELEETVTLRGGRAFWLAPIRPEDENALIDMLSRSAPEDIRLRFFAPIRNIGHAFAARLTQIDYSREMAFVARAAGDPDGDILGAARIVTDAEGIEGEFGIMVRSDQKGKGLGYALMQKILSYARARGMRRVFAEVLAENTSMLALAQELGFVRQAPGEDMTIRHVELELDRP